MHQNAKEEVSYDKIERYRRMLHQAGAVELTQNPKSKSYMVTETWKLHITNVEDYKSVSINLWYTILFRHSKN